MNTTDAATIQAIASIMQAFGLIFVIWQVRLLHKQIAVNHERGRRIRAIDDIATWNRGLDKAQTSARSLVEKLPHNDCKLLIKRESFVISKEKLTALEYILDGVGKIEQTASGISLDSKQAAHILFLCLNHLNSLELALQGWFHGVADSKIIEKQLAYLYEPSEDRNLLKTLREDKKFTGRYPAINAFTRKLEENKSLENNERPRKPVA